jgi:glycosyltransferase involved in cell wall biosynthesis
MALAEPRIAFCVPRYGLDVVGGAETLCRLVAENLAAHGTPVEVLTTTAVDHFTWADHHPEGTSVEGGVPVHRFRVSADRDGQRFWSHHVAIAVGEEIDYAGQLEWMAQSVWSPGLQAAAQTPGRYEWLIAVPYLFGVGFWAAAARPERTAFIPCVHDEPHAWSDVVRDALTGARGNLLNSGGERELISRLAPAAEWRIVGVGFDEEPPPGADEVAAFCAARGISPGYLLYAGRREEAKGLPLLFAHYASLRRARPDAPKLALMGSGDLAVPEEIADWTIDLGYVPTAQRAAAYAGASLLVHPSRLESLGMVMLEAWLAGTPALVNAGSPVLVQHCRSSGGGLWFASEEEFVAAACALLDDPPLRAEMARCGAAYVFGEFSWAEVRRRFRAALADWA